MSMDQAIRLWMIAGCLLCALATAPPCNGAGTENPVGPGTRIRVTAPALPNGVLVGSLLKVSGDTLAMQAPDSSHALVSVRSIMSLERSTGSGRGIRKKMMIGFVVGAVVGAVIGAAAVEESVGAERDAEVFAAAVTVGLMGSAGGLLVGLISPNVEHWTRIEPTRMGTRLTTPSPGAFALGVSFGF
jgi:hypothetical protein